MKRIAIIGGGVAGLAAAYELEVARKRGADLDWHLYEATDRLGGTVETTVQNGFVLEGGPDAWVTDKPWARDLAVHLGLEAELIESNDATKRTCILLDGELQAMPGRMRMMVPEDLATLDSSPIFTASAKQAYANELARGDAWKQEAPSADESVASFVRRHFGDEVLTKIAAPLLSGVFGGDVDVLSVRSVMPAFVTMEQEHGSLIAALQSRAQQRGDKPASATFTTLRRGMGSLVEAIIATLPPARLHLGRRVTGLKRESGLWCVRSSAGTAKNPAARRTAKRHVHHVLLAAPLDAARSLLEPLDTAAAALIPADASSAVLATFCWPAEDAARFTVPPGFGFLVPQQAGALQLLACTFVDQKFSHRVPLGARAIRVFYGGQTAATMMSMTDHDIAQRAFAALKDILARHTGTAIPDPDPTLTTVRRWPRSLPQYTVGHMERMAELDARIAALKDITLLGNAWRGVGVPDIIRDARATAHALAASA